MISCHREQGQKISKVRFIILIVLILLVFPVFPASENSTGPSLNDFLGKLVNSLILFGGLIFLMRKRLIEFFSNKSLDIGNEMKTREMEIKMKEEKINELIERLGKLKEEINQNMVRARESGRKEKSNIEKAGRGCFLPYD